MEVSLDPIIQYLAQIAFVVIMALGSWALKALADKVGMAKEGQLMGYLEDGLAKGARLASKRIQERGGDADTVIQNEAIAEGVQYVVDALPKTVKKLGYDSEKVRKMIEARL